MSECTGKVRFPSKVAAYMALKRRFKKHAAMNVYQCGKGHWHLGRTRDPYRCAERITQVLEQHDRDLKARLSRKAPSNVS